MFGVVPLFRCYVPTNIEPWKFMLCMRQMAHNSWHQQEIPCLQNYQHVPSYSCKMNTANQSCWRFLQARMPCCCHERWSTCLHAHNYTTVCLTGTHCTTCRAIGADSFSLPRIGKVPPCPTSCTMHSLLKSNAIFTRKHSFSGEKRVIQGLGPGNTTFPVQPSMDWKLGAQWELKVISSRAL